MKYITKLIPIAVSVLVISNYAHAELTLTDYVSQEVSSLDEAFNEVGSLEESKESDEAYFFRRFWLRLRPRVGLKVPGFATFDVVPEVEMLWEKETPDDWEIYKP